jgi:hypothetical protein
MTLFLELRVDLLDQMLVLNWRTNRLYVLTGVELLLILRGQKHLLVEKLLFEEQGIGLGLCAETGLQLLIRLSLQIFQLRFILIYLGL